MNQKLKIAVGISGSGRSLENLIANQSHSAYEIAFVFSSNPEAAGLQFAKNAGIPFHCGSFSIENTQATIHQLKFLFQEHKIQLICLAGFIKLFPMQPPWNLPIINIHPALLPKFGGRGMYGIRVHQAVLAAGETLSGATVHFVNQHYDKGSIIAQVEVPVYKSDSAELLGARVFAAEQKLLPWCIDHLLKINFHAVPNFKRFKFENERLILCEHQQS